MSRACFDCGPDNLDDCAREECVPADGVPRAFLAVNRQLPGPAIQVCEGDRVVVDVYNELFSDSETIHWHGQHQRGSQYMDGVPFVTQCPILPGVFRYDMPYLNHGTYWYHSHSGLHRGDGVLGAMVVRRIEDQQAQYYDTDLLSHVLMVQDWTHKPMMAQSEGLVTIELPFETIEVSPGHHHRLRIISGVAMNCPMIVSIDNLDFTIIA